MSAVKKLAFILVILLTLSFNDVIENNNFKVVTVMSDSSIQINGSTNVNTFICDLNLDQVNSVITANYLKNDNRLNFNNTVIEFQNNCFDCGSNVMNKEFLKMLNTELFPNIILELSEVVTNPSDHEDIYVHLIVSLAGCTQNYCAPITLEHNTIYKALGCLSLRLSDFNLSPPKKALGLITVSNEIDINFDLKIKP